MSRKQVTFNEDEKEDKEIKILKVEYIWQNNLDEFHSRNKILKIAGKRVSIPMTSTNYKDDEYILNPKFITINPFKIGLLIVPFIIILRFISPFLKLK